MLSQPLEKFLYEIPSSQVTDWFIGSILVVFLISIYEAKKLSHSRFLEHAPNVMTSIGILGTFVGIVIGLLHFDPLDIESSIPVLLGGLKTAFITSLVGMLSAILFKGLDSWWFAPAREQSGEKADITPRDIHSAISDTNDRLTALQKSLVGAEEGSLIGQIKMARSELNDANRLNQSERKQFAGQLFEEMQNFATLLSKSATEQVIEALRQVIVDFNRNLVEQFGDNFKKLDAAVEKLVHWQNQYMVQLGQMIEQYAEGVKAIGDTRNAVIAISESTATIPHHLEQLTSVVQVNQHQIQELQRHLDAFVVLRDKAIAAVPQIQAQLDDVGKQMLESSQAMKVVMLEGATDFKSSVSQTNTAMRELANNMQSQGESISATLQDAASGLSNTSRDMLARLEDGAKSMQNNLNDSVTKAQEMMKNSIQTTLSGLESEAKRAVGTTGEAMTKQIDELDKALAHELETTMQHMGRALASITKQFADDYTGLVESMRRVVSARVS